MRSGDRLLLRQIPDDLFLFLGRGLRRVRRDFAGLVICSLPAGRIVKAEMAASRSRPTFSALSRISVLIWTASR